MFLNKHISKNNELEVLFYSSEWMSEVCNNLGRVQAHIHILFLRILKDTNCSRKTRIKVDVKDRTYLWEHVIG